MMSERNNSFHKEHKILVENGVITNPAHGQKPGIRPDFKPPVMAQSSQKQQNKENSKKK